MDYYGNEKGTKAFLAFASIFILVFILLDRLLISQTQYLNYLDCVKLGFELNKLANTLTLEGLILFIGIGPLFLLAVLLFYVYTRMNKPSSPVSPFRSFAIVFHFFVSLLAMNILGGVAYYICSVTPGVRAVNDFFSELILIRIYLDLPFVEKFQYSTCYINFSLTNLLGLVLLSKRYFRESLKELVSYFAR